MSLCGFFSYGAFQGSWEGHSLRVGAVRWRAGRGNRFGPGTRRADWGNDRVLTGTLFSLLQQPPTTEDAVEPVEDVAAPVEDVVEPTPAPTVEPTSEVTALAVRTVEDDPSTSTLRLPTSRFPAVRV